MTRAANDNIHVVPRGLRRVAAAAYLGISPSHFDKQRAAGAIPAPRKMLGVVLWDRNDLDRLFDDTAAVPQNDNVNEWDGVLNARQNQEAPLGTSLR
jgi:hypothetical protein